MNRPARSGAAVAALLLTASMGTAQASEDTEISPMLKGDVDINYGGQVFNASLREQGIDVGQVTRSSQTATLTAHFGVAPGVEAYVAVPFQVGGSWSYSDVSQVNTCPDDPQPEACEYGLAYGTALVLGRATNGAPAWSTSREPLAESEVPNYTISGLGDMALGLRLAPFSRRYLGREEPRSGRFNSKATWIIDLGLMVPVGPEFFSAGENQYGASSGKTGFRFRTALAKRMNRSEPYVSFEYRLRPEYETYVSLGASEVTVLNPQDELRFFAGTELIPYEDSTSGNRFSVDISMGYHYRSEGVWASGYLLPSVLTEEQVNAAGLNTADVITFGEAVEIDEQLGALGRVRLRFAAFNHVDFHMGVALGYYLPSQVERAYNIRYGRAIGVEYEFGLAGRW